VDRGERISDQAAVWADIAEKSERMQAESPTAAMAQIFTDHAAPVDAFVEGFEPIEGQCGALFAIGHRIVGFDLFDHAGTLRKLLPKLVRSYAIDAIDPAPSRDSRGVRLQAEGLRVQAEALLVPAFLAALGAAPQQCGMGVGLGEDVRLAANGLVGAALVVDEQVVHLCGFTA
jgi:ARG/rhodanese/phosphatase superfamily protein